MAYFFEFPQLTPLWSKSLERATAPKAPYATEKEQGSRKTAQQVTTRSLLHAHA